MLRRPIKTTADTARQEMKTFPEYRERAKEGD
jgi:hypothetical protein